MAPHGETGGAQPRLHHAAAVDTHVTTLDVVVFVRERPVDEFRPKARNGDRHCAAGSQDAGEFSHGTFVVWNVLEHLRADHTVKTGVRKRQMQRVPLHDSYAAAAVGEFTRFDHGGERPENAVDLVCSRVEGHHVRPAASGLVGVTTKATPEVQDGVAGFQPESVVVRGEHQAKVTEAGSGKPFMTAS